MNEIGLKKWILRALRSTLKEGSHEKEENSKNVKRRRLNFLRLEFCNVRSNKMCNKLRKLGISNILKTIGLLLIAPSLIFGSWILLSQLLGIPNEILRPLLIWLFIFSLFFSGVIVGLVYQYKEKRRLKK